MTLHAFVVSIHLNVVVQADVVQLHNVALRQWTIFTIVNTNKKSPFSITVNVLLHIYMNIQNIVLYFFYIIKVIHVTHHLLVLSYFGSSEG